MPWLSCCEIKIKFSQILFDYASDYQEILKPLFGVVFCYQKSVTPLKLMHWTYGSYLWFVALNYGIKIPIARSTECWMDAVGCMVACLQPGSWGVLLQAIKIPTYKFLKPLIGAFFIPYPHSFLLIQGLAVYSLGIFTNFMTIVVKFSTSVV